VGGPGSASCKLDSTKASKAPGQSRSGAALLRRSGFLGTVTLSWCPLGMANARPSDCDSQLLSYVLRAHEGSRSSRLHDLVANERRSPREMATKTETYFLAKPGYEAGKFVQVSRIN